MPQTEFLPPPAIKSSLYKPASHQPGYTEIPKADADGEHGGSAVVDGKTTFAFVCDPDLPGGRYVMDDRPRPAEAPPQPAAVTPAPEPAPAPAQPDTTMQVEKMMAELWAAAKPVEPVSPPPPAPLEPELVPVKVTGPFGTIDAMYHYAHVEGACIVLAYDTRFRVGAKFTPPVLPEHDLIIEIRNHRYQARSLGLRFSFTPASMEMIILVKTEEPL